MLHIVDYLPNNHSPPLPLTTKQLICGGKTMCLAASHELWDSNEENPLHFLGSFATGNSHVTKLRPLSTAPKKTTKE